MIDDEEEIKWNNINNLNYIEFIKDCYGNRPDLVLFYNIKDYERNKEDIEINEESI